MSPDRGGGAALLSPWPAHPAAPAMKKSRRELLSAVKLLDREGVRGAAAALALPGADRLDIMYQCTVSREARGALRAHLFSRCKTPPPLLAAAPEDRHPPATPLAAPGPRCKRHLDFGGL